ncbi:MAG: hypothetical protein VYE55_00790 [Verrucomicrobiota bacterium]|nr:hypothetical protein [Verrucomicrobiota bacterium]
MGMLNRLEKKFGSWAVPNVMLYIVISQLVVYALLLTGMMSFATMPLIPAAVIQEQQFWRLITFIIAPPYVPAGAFGGLFLAIFWYILWMMSGAIESAWGTFRFNCYLLIGIFLTIVGAFIGYWISPMAPIVIFPNFLYISVFFAFAVLNPNFEFYLFFVLPVKVKWFAYFSAALLLFEVLTVSTLGERVVIIMPVMNFVLFFRATLSHSFRSSQRRKQFQAQSIERSEQALHTCSLCPATDKSHPDLDFRYRFVEGEHVCVCSACRDKH